MNKLFTKIAAVVLGATMATGVGVAVATSGKEASPVQALAAGDISTSPVSSVVAGKKYVIASSSNAQTAPSGSQFLAAKASNTWGTAVAIGSAYEFTAEGSGTSGFYLKCKDGYLAPKTGTSNTFLQYASSASNAVKLQLKNTYELFSNTNAHYNLRQNGTSGFRWYGTASADGSTGTAARLYEVSESVPVTGVTLDKNALTLTVGDSETLTATVSPNDATDKSVTWSSSKPSVALVTNGTVSAQSAGTATITVTTTDGGFQATCDVTVNNPTTPAISLNGSSFTGFTGQSFSVTATYSNLTSAFAWSTSGSGTTTETITSTGTSTDGTSTYSGTLTGAGTKTLSATGGGATTQTYTVSITKVTVDITKASTSIPVGRSETLAATHNASAVGGLTWTSNNAKVSVGSDGKVTVANDATVGSTATITATSSVDTSVSDTCTVIVAEAPLDTTYDFVTNFANYNDGWTNSYTTHEGINGKTQVGGDYAATIDLYYASKQTGTITDRPVFASKTASGSWAEVIHFTLNESNYKIADVQVTFSQWGSKTPDVALFSGSEATGTPLDSGTIGTKNTISTTGLNDTEFTVGYCDKNTGSNVQAGLTSIYITLAKNNALDHVTVSFDSDPADRTFTAGENFAFNGTLTASYTVDSPKAVTPSGYFIEGEEGTGDPITTSDILNVADHNGADIYVQYEEGGITKYDTFTLIVNAAPATSVTLSANVGSVALEEVFEVSSIIATVNPQQYAAQGVTWDIDDLGGLTEDDYAFDGTEFHATKPADVVFHVKSTTTPSVYAVFTLTITGDPIAHLLDSELVDVTDGSASVFGDVGTLTYGVTTENFEGTMSYTWSTSNSSIISIDDDQGDMCDFYVEGTGGSARLSCRVQGSTKGDVTVYIDVTVTAVTVTSVTWNAPTINVYSGATLSTSGWNVRYSTNSGKTDVQADSFDILLGGSVVSSGYAFAAADDGKALTVRVGNTVSETSTTVSVTQTLRPVWAPVPGETSTSSLVFEAACGGSGTSDGGEEWTVTSDGTESTYDATKGIHYGTGSAAVQYIKLTTSDFSVGNITRVVVNASTASGVSATAGVKINGVQFGGEPQSLSSSAAEYTFTGEVAASTIEVEITKPSSANKAIYCKSIVVTYATPSGEDVNIANIAGHEAAQKAVVKFAKAFNAALGTTENCTTGLSTAWSNATSAWNTFLSEASALGEAEEAYAKKLVKYATAQWTENTDDNYEYCLERCLATYEKCVLSHGQTAFMSDVRPVSGRAPVSPIAIATSENVNTIAIVAIVSIIGVSAIGGYFFLRKRKETN